MTRSLPLQGLPPYNESVEHSALCSLMLIGSSEERGKIIEALSSESFHDPQRRMIFDAIKALHERGQPVDLVTVEHALRDKLDNARLILSGLREDASTFHDGLVHARIVVELAREREAQRLIDAWQRNGAKASQLDEMIEGLREIMRVADDDEDALDVFDFVAQSDDEYEWLISGVLERSDRMLLTGREGFGKSYLSQQIAVQLAAGVHPFAADAKQEALTVLLVDLENPSHELRRRMRLFAHVAGERLQRGRLFVRSRPAGIDLGQSDEDRGWLRREHERTKPDLLVIGPLYKLGHADPNDERESKPVALFLDELRTAFDSAVLLEAHMTHEGGGRPFGWSGWRRWPDVGIELTEAGLLKPWRPARHETPLLPPALKRGGEWPWSVAMRARDVLWGQVVVTCEQRVVRPSVRDLADSLGADRNAVQRAIKEHESEWDALFDE